ncbi:hypothetical protein Q0M94_11875 [Deinococcus radiomollis]|uniref:hypothetical protein n=1 Tax=Deinococcus radiomollis TaxID=468916 RepID=UPI003891A10F
MSKTDPRPYDFILAPGSVAFTLTARFNGLVVNAIEGGSATRNGTALAAGNTLAAGDVIASASPASTVTLACQHSGEEFSGAYIDLSGAPAGGGGGGATTAENYVPLIGVNLDALGAEGPGSPYTSLIASQPGIRFTAAAATTVTSMRAIVRIAAASSNTQANPNMRLQVNGTIYDLANVGTISRGKYYRLIEGYTASPVSIPANADVYYWLTVTGAGAPQLEVPTQGVYDNYNSRGMVGNVPTAVITQASASAPVTFMTQTPAAASNNFPTMELGTKTKLATKTAVETLPYFPAAPTAGWGVVESNPPRVIAVHNGLPYSLALQPDVPVNSYVSPGTPISQIPGAQLLNNEMSIITAGSNQILAVRINGTVYQIGILTALNPQP